MTFNFLKSDHNLEAFRITYFVQNHQGIEEIPPEIGLLLQTLIFQTQQ